MQAMSGPRVLLYCAAVAISACHKQTANDHASRAQTYADQAHYREAIVELRTALNIEPRRGDLRLKLGDTYTRVGDGPSALREYVRAADVMPSSIDAQLKAGRLLLVARRFEESKARAEKVLALDADNVDAQILRGNALASLKDLDGAIADYEDAVAQDPSRNDAYQSLGAIQFARGKREEAEAAFKKAVESAPKSVAAHLAMANFYWATERRSESEQALKAAVAIDPQHAGANRALGVFYLASGQAGNAEPYFQALANTSDWAPAKLTLAQYYIVVARYDDARKVLQELAKRNDAYASATIRLATLDAIQGQRAEAKARISEVLTKQPRNASAQLVNAALFFLDRQWTEALPAVNAALETDRNSARAHLLAGRIYTALDRTEEAVQEYEQAVKLDPRPITADLELVRLHLNAGATDKALTYALQALTILPRHAEVHNLLARVYLRRGELGKAKREVEVLQQAYPNLAATFTVAALMQTAEKRVEAARASYDRALQLDPTDLEALEGVVRIDLSSGHAQNAVTRVDGVLARAKPTTELMLLAARTYASAGDLASSESFLQRAIEVDPARLQGYALLGQLYAKQRRLQEAVEKYREVVKRNPKSVTASTMVGMLLESLGRLEEAEKQYQQVLGIDSHAAVAANNLAYLYASSDRKLDEALRLAQTAQQQLPDEGPVNDTIGWVYVKKRMGSLAIPHLESSVKKTPNDPVAQYHLGIAYVQTGHWDKAKGALKRALELKADFEGAAEARKALETIGA
jgi:putative PEP-CTERM system TPR-repeat lipoprotein